MHYRFIEPGEEPTVYALIERVFDEFVAPGYSEEGRLTFLNYANPESLRKHLQSNHFILVAESPDGLHGVIEMRNHEHISLLFVDKASQGKGVARELLRQALDLCKAQRPDLERVTVNSSPYAIPIYEKLGFHAVADEQITHGLRYTPMMLNLEDWPSAG
jgi:GNAT superfamily N-acetyltransferase